MGWIQGVLKDFRIVEETCILLKALCRRLQCRMLCFSEKICSDWLYFIYSQRHTFTHIHYFNNSYGCMVYLSIRCMFVLCSALVWCAAYSWVWLCCCFTGVWADRRGSGDVWRTVLCLISPALYWAGSVSREGALLCLQLRWDTHGNVMKILLSHYC